MSLGWGRWKNRFWGRGSTPGCSQHHWGSGTPPPLQIWGVAETWDGNEAPQLQGLGKEGTLSPNPRAPVLLSIFLVLEWEGQWEGTLPAVSPRWVPGGASAPGTPEFQREEGWGDPWEKGGSPGRIRGDTGGVMAGGDTPVQAVASGAVLGAQGGWGGFGAEASGMCWIPKLLSQHLAPEGGGDRTPWVCGCGETGDPLGPSGDPTQGGSPPGDADKGGGPG